jgi:hypothetical protein
LSLTLREGHKLRVYENKVLRIFGLKRDELTGRWRNLHNEELRGLYSSPSTGCSKLASFFLQTAQFKKGS